MPYGVPLCSEMLNSIVRRRPRENVKVILKHFLNVGPMLSLFVSLMDLDYVICMEWCNDYLWKCSINTSQITMHHVKSWKRECPVVNITHTKSLLQIFHNSLYIFEKQSIPITGFWLLLIDWKSLMHISTLTVPVPVPSLNHLESHNSLHSTSCVDLSIASLLDAVISYKVLTVGHSLFLILWTLGHLVIECSLLRSPYSKCWSCNMHVYMDLDECLVIHECYIYSRSQNNVNVVYCNYKETNSSYNVIAKRNSPQTLLIAGNIFKIFVWNFEEACVI